MALSVDKASHDLAAYRLRGLISQFRISRAETAALLRELAAELDAGPADAHVIAAVEHAASALRSEGFRVTIDQQIGTQAAARLLDRAPKSLRNWRCAGTGPAWHADGGIVLYRIVDVLAWRAGVSRSVPIHDADCMR